MTDVRNDAVDEVEASQQAVPNRRNVFGRLYHGETAIDFYGRRWWGLPSEHRPRASTRADRPSGNANGHNSPGEVVSDDRPCTHDRALTDRHTWQDDGAGTDVASVLHFYPAQPQILCQDRSFGTRIRML